MRVADFLFPSDLSVSTTPITKILVTGSCMAVEYYHHALSLGIKADYVATNGYAEPVPPPSPIGDYDFEVVQLALREIVTDRIIAFSRFADAAFRRQIFEDAEQSLRLRMAAYLKNSRERGTLTFVCNFLVPQAPVASSLKGAGTGADFASLVRHLNALLAEIVAHYPSAYVSDIDAIAGSMGRRHMQDDVVHFFSHGSSWGERVQIFDTSPEFNAPAGGRLEAVPPHGEIYPLRESEFLDAVWRQWVALYRTVNQIDPVKLVIFDLDDTLWRGQIAEHYGEGGWPAHHGWPLGLWEAVHHLKARGILTALCSKNEESLVRERWSRAVMDDWVTPEDFTFVEISWTPKAESIAKIIRNASVTAKSVVFIDDNPVERAAVKAAFPDIRLLGSNPYVVRRVLLWSSETQVARLTAESTNRDAMMRQQQKREREKAEMSREDFLAGLDCKVRVNRIVAQDGPDYTRAFELLNKTNQFNTTGKRWTSSDVAGFFQSGGNFFVFDVEDRFTAYGLVGVILYQKGHFHQFAMSCRVLGLEIETSMINAILKAEAANHQAGFVADVVETDANMVCRDIYRKCGFEPDGPGRFKRSSRNIAASTSHLAIEGLTPAPTASRWWRPLSVVR